MWKSDWLGGEVIRRIAYLMESKTKGEFFVCLFVFRTFIKTATQLKFALSDSEASISALQLCVLCTRVCLI